MLLTTGIEDVLPDLSGIDEAIKQGTVRLCPVCDAFEAIDRRVLVLGNADGSSHKALFLRRYTRHTAYLHQSDATLLNGDELDALKDHGVELLEPRGAQLTVGEEGIILQRKGESRLFDIMYPALGSRIRSQLATELGADAEPDGCVKVDAHQETSVRGLFAAGDVVAALDQISVAVGHAAIAATTIHRRLADGS